MNRILAYRLIEGVNQQEVGQQLSLSPQMVSAIEGGRRAFSVDLEMLGYSNNRLELPPMSPPMHRQRASTTVTSNNRAKELLRLAGEVFAELRAETPKAPRLRIERLDTPRSVDEVEEIAVDVRAMLDHDDVGPIPNLTTAVELAGVCIVPITGLDGIDGISSWVNGVPVIGLSPTVPGDRFRLSLGHELGHLTFHHVKSDSTEGEANRFAGALLIPLAQFTNAMPDRPQLRDFVGMKSAWGVSVAALVYRAHELGFIDDSRYRSLQIQMSKWRRDEPGAFAPKHGELLTKMVEVHGGVGEVARKLGVNPKHLDAITNWSHLRLA